MATTSTLRLEAEPYGLPTGTVRGFLSVLICSFFWLVLLTGGDNTQKAPLAHFFLLSLVFLAFASHPVQELRVRAVLPWVMRLLFVGGSAAILIFVAIQDPNRLAARLTPNADEMSQWPVLLGCLAGGFGVGLMFRAVLGRENQLFQTLRAWFGVLAMLLLLFETLFHFVIMPQLSDKPSLDVLKIWEGILIAITAAYFGSRA